MHHFDYSTIAAAVLVLGSLVMVARVTSGKWERRKRRRNYGRVVTRSRYPALVLHVKTTRS